MPVLDKVFPKVVKSLLKSLGTTCTVARRASGYVPETDEEVRDVPDTVLTIRCTPPQGEVHRNPAVEFAYKQVGEQDYDRNLTRLFVSAVATDEEGVEVAFVPVWEDGAQDRVTINNETFVVVSAVQITSGAVTVAWDLKMRR